jgi:hypothetical protein
MLKSALRLTEIRISNAEARSKPYKLFDGGGLYLNILPSGSRIWRFKFRQHNRKENQLTFGPYPKISLQEARDRCYEAHQLMRQGVDLVKHRNEAKRVAAEITAKKFENTACARNANHVPPLTDINVTNLITQLEMEISGLISYLSITERKYRDIIDTLRTIKESLPPGLPSARKQ